MLRKFQDVEGIRSDESVNKFFLRNIHTTKFGVYMNLMEKTKNITEMISYLKDIYDVDNTFSKRHLLVKVALRFRTFSEMC